MALPWLPEGTNPLPGDTEVRSLWKINALAAQWATNLGANPQCEFLGTVQPSPHDTEVISLQKINACFAAIVQNL
jgi:hypothetical protein